MLRFKTLAFCLFFTTFLFGQAEYFEMKNVQLKEHNAVLAKEFKAYDIFQLDTRAIHQFVQSEGSDINLSLKFGKKYDWKLLLEPKDIRSEDYTVEIQTENGREILPKRPNMTYRGYLDDAQGGKVGLTINEEHFAGTVKKGDELYFIEPLRYLVKDANPELYIVYAVSDVIPHEGLTCGADELIEKLQEKHHDHKGHDHKGHDHAEETLSAVGLCLEVDLAIASDWLMYQDYNQSTTQVEDHNITVMNNVGTNYDDEFDDEIVFVIVTQFISTCSTCDPWTSSTAAGTLLGSFRNWGNGGGFGVQFDLGQLWTDRNLNGPTIGIAYVSGLCTNNRYHVCQDFTTNQQQLRVLTAHEIGHNFSSLHDNSGGFIMSPSVNTSTVWSAQSQNSVNNLVATRLNQGGCFSECVVAQPPIADFSASQTSGCAPLSIQFSDLSANAPTQWEWSFPGGTPAFSFEQNPTVTYNTPGVYDVSLTVTNSAGTNTILKPAYINVLGTPIANFDVNVNDNIAVFTNNTQSANAYFWDFGDGNTSTDFSPIHFYDEDGVYTVTLTATNACGTNVYTQIVTIATLPIPNFTSNVVSGCPPLSVTFEDLSTSNTDFWFWEMPGANPDQSAEQNPTVVYNNPGSYDVTLTVINEVGSNTITFEDYIIIDPLPSPSFTFSEDGTTVNFSNTSTNGDSYLWDFGDNNTSTIENPSHTYDSGGTYIVTLTATNECGEQTITETIEIAVAPIAGFSANTLSGCAPLTVLFSDNSTANVDTWEWSFPGGNPSSSNEQNPEVVYETSGIYDVSLIVTNEVGADTLTQVQYITINDVPEAGFTSSVNGLEVDFTNTSTNGDSYSWDFGDGNSSTEENPNHSYDEDGTYTVVLSVTNECGTVEIEEEITIITAPLAGFSANVTSGCADLTVEFSDESTANATSWEWTFEGGNPSSSTEQNPVVVYTMAGTYTVTLEVSNAAGSNTVTETNYIVINDVPEAGFTSSVNGMEVDFTNTSTNGDSYSWDFGDGNSSTEENPSHTYNEDGTYTVVLSVTNECGTVEVEEEVTIITAPVAGFSANVTSGCADLTVEFSDESTANATSWEWTFEGGNPSSSTEQNPVVEYTMTGTYTVTLEVSNAAGSNTVTETNYIVVNDVPEAGFTSSVNGTEVAFTNTSTNGDSYSWDFGDGNSSTEENPSHTYNGDGTYTVVLSVTNECGTVETEEEITIITAPVAGFSANVTSGCADLTVEFSDESTANATSWEWTFEGGNPSSSTEQNPVVEYTMAGTYTVTLEVSNAAGSNTVTETNYIVVNDVPEAGFTSLVDDAQVDFINTSTNANSYSWDFGDGNSSTEENPVHTYDVDGEYTVILTATNDCGSVTSSQLINIGTLPTAGFSANVTSGCLPLTVQFSDQSSANTTEWSWTFEGGIPATSTLQNPEVVFEEAGTYTVTLVATNDAGSNTITQTGYILVNTVPLAGFNSNTNGTITDFVNTSTNGDTYSWDFGDGNSSTEENPQHDFQTDGTYVVTLTATNECGSETSSETITIVTPPTAGFSANVTSGCADLTVQFSDQSSSNATAWLWTFEGGNPATSTLQNPSVSYATAGLYNVTLEVTNAAGSNEVIQTDYIVVNNVPLADFSVASAGAVISFTNTSVNGDTYSWDFGDGNNSTEENPVHTYDADGDYEVTLSVSNECGTTVSMQTVTAVIAPVAGFGSNVTSGCAPLTVEFSNQSIGTVDSYNWSFPGGNPSSSTAENPVVVYENPGVYTVELEVTNVAGSNTAVQTNYIVVNTVPTIGFNGNITGTGINFVNTSVGATNFTWDFGNGNSSNDTNPFHDFETDGIYTVTLTAENECGSVSLTETFEIVTEPLAGFSADITTGCADMTVNFMDMSSGNTTSWLWTFEGGSPSSSTEQHPTVVYDTPGSYTVTLVATTSAGSNTYTQNQFIIVNTVPDVDFSTTVSGATINFLNNTTGGTTYLWEFGDGSTSELPNPEHTYAEDGDYTVSLTATNACGSTMTTQTVSVVSLPAALFSADVTIGCGPLDVNFMDMSTGNVSNWNWTFSGGSPTSSTEQNPSVTYEIPGTYSVTLEVTNSAGTDVQTITSYIVVEDLPQPDFNASITGSTAIFTNTSSGGTSYSWDFGDGNGSTEESPFHIYEDDGEYTVTLTVINSCGSVMTTQQVLVVTPPVAAFVADTLFGCEPFLVQFTDLSSNNTVSRTWTFEGGTPATSTEANPIVTYNSAGTYDVTLVVSNAAGNNTAMETDYVTVGEAPTAGFTSAVTEATADFTNTSIAGDTYSWDFGEGGTSSETNPTYEYDSPGDYEVTLTVTNSCGSSTITQTVSIVGQVPAAAFAADITAGCAPLTVNFEDMSTGTPTAWSWAFAGGSPATSTEQNPTITYANAGTYEVSLTVTNAFGENTITETSYITVNAAPEADFNYTVDAGIVEFESMSTGASSYEWDFGDGDNSTEENPTHQYEMSGVYTVVLTVTNDCGTSTIEETLDIVILDVEDFENIDFINLYPNPNNGQFTLLIEGQVLGNLEFQFYDIIGQKLHSEILDFTGGRWIKNLDFRHLAAGAYILQLRSDNKVLHRKVVIE